MTCTSSTSSNSSHIGFNGSSSSIPAPKSGISLSSLPPDCLSTILSYSGPAYSSLDKNFTKAKEGEDSLNRKDDYLSREYLEAFEKGFGEHGQEEFNALKRNSGITREGYLAQVQLYKISSFAKAQMKNLQGGEEVLRNKGLLPIVSISRYRETQQWIKDENFLKCISASPDGAEALRTLNTLSHAEKAESMRLWLDNYTEIENIAELNLNGLGLTELPPEICKFTNLRTLNLANNRLATLPPEIGQLGNLRELLLTNNRLETLPPEIGQLGNLGIILLNKNRLKTLPPEIGQLNLLLWCLNLDNNRLETLPPEIGQLGNLLFLDLGNNRLEALLPQFFQLVRLSELKLNGNRLKNLSSQISQFVRLTTLDLRNNLLTTLPAEIAQLGELSTLSVQKNPLKSLPKPLTNKFCKYNITDLSKKSLFLLGYGKKVAAGIAASLVLATGLLADRLFRT